MADISWKEFSEITIDMLLIWIQKLISVSLLNNIGNNCNDSDTFIVEFVGLVTKSWKHLDFYTPKSKNMILHNPSQHVGMGQYLLITFLVGWTSIYQLFWCSPGVPGFWPIPIWEDDGQPVDLGVVFQNFHTRCRGTCYHLGVVHPRYQHDRGSARAFGWWWVGAM